jgi:hypothetical protein
MSFKPGATIPLIEESDLWIMEYVASPRGACEHQNFKLKKPRSEDLGFFSFHRKVADPEGFEPPTNWFEASYSIQLSYGSAFVD